MSLSNASKTWFPILSLPLGAGGRQATLTSRPRHRVMRLWTTPRRICPGVGGEDLAGHEATPYAPPSPSPHVESLWQLSSTPVLTFSPGGRQFFLLASSRHVGSDCEVCHISDLRCSGSRYTKVDPALCYCRQRSSSLFQQSSQVKIFVLLLHWVFMASGQCNCHCSLSVSVRLCLLVMINWIYLGFLDGWSYKQDD